LNRRAWLEVEMALIRPRVLVCLGATAAHTVFGSAYRVTKEHGQFIAHPCAPYATSTNHPSAILRMPGADERQTEYAKFVTDLKLVHTQLLETRTGGGTSL
jgi:uracil-DNA glycosylase family 4